MPDKPLRIEQGFPPLLGLTPHTIILGSMPSIKSLEQQQYYAHPRNAFWPIMAELFNFDTASSYQQRCTALKQHHIVVWDVVKSGQREGSLDQNIHSSDLTLNDFDNLFTTYPTITKVFFNGAKSESLFKSVLPILSSEFQTLSMQRLPSTSPAHAAMTFEQKLRAWRVIL
tara:strand:+ start:149 stop:661 length:513 start_codon:yes stop_codon:yes gene_type:complete